ncbi:MAG: hypothetical protein JSR58_00410 [Verrucomicrobia bacterium]|nr:hypothetical protein [Verrucomicrobiota bacterium]
MKFIQMLLAFVAISVMNAADLTIICLHPGPAGHFADFTKVLDKEKISYQVVAAEKGAEELKKRQISFIEFKRDVLLKDLPPTEAAAAAEKILKLTAGSQKILLDVGNPFAATILQNLKNTTVETIAYYDNPESLVEGGYSESVSLVLPKVQKVFFANKNLASTPIFIHKNQPISYTAHPYGIGYCDMADVENIARLHGQHKTSPQEKVLVYVGGANDKYYTAGITTFLKLLTEASQKHDLSRFHVIFRQHGRALQEGNIDGKLIQEWKKNAPNMAPRLTFSDTKESFNEAIAKADVLAYFQTSASPKFVLAGIPVMQISSEKMEDAAVDTGACPRVEDAEVFLAELIRLSESKDYPQETKDKIRAKIGYDTAWAQNFVQALNK